MPLRAGGKHSDGNGYIYYSYAASAIEYAKNNGARIISMSFGGDSNTLKNAAIDAYNNNVVVFHAAGNDNIDSPDVIDGIVESITVAATDQNDIKAWFSNYGSWVDVSAPGVSIYNTYFNNTYASLSGTSMSSPLAAGLAGLILSKNLTLSSSEVTDIIINSTDNIDSQNPSYVGKLGSGRINAYEGLRATSAGNAFTISNTGAATLVVDNISSNKAWLSFNPPAPPDLNIPQNDSRAISCIVDWHNVPFPSDQATVTINSNDPDENPVIVTVTAHPQAPSPVVTSITPNSGVNTGPVDITDLAGSNFQSGATVKLTKSGQSDINGTSVVVVNSNKITCTFDLTGKATGPWNVVVTNPDGQSGSLADGFTVILPAPMVTAIAPSIGVNDATTDVTVTGTNFVATPTVQIGTTSCINMVWVNATTLTATVPSGIVPSVYAVVVTNPDGQSGSLADGFTVILPAPIAKLAFTTPSFIVETNESSPVITVQTQDISGSPADVDALTTIDLSSTSMGGEFSTAPDFGTIVSSVQIPAGENAASFYYRDSEVGNPTITVSENPDQGWTDANQTVTIIPPFVISSDILLVDDDRGNSYENYYESALTANSLAYDLWDVSLRGEVPLDILDAYQGEQKCVIWFTGDDWTYTLTASEQTNLSSFLEGGGRLFISGQDIGYDLDNNPDVTWYETYLHAHFVTDDVELYSLFGASGDPIGDGLSIGIAGGDGADNQYYPSEIDPISPAVTVFTYETGGEMVLVERPDHVREEGSLRQRDVDRDAVVAKRSSQEREGSDRGIGSSGTGGLRVDTGTYKLVYLAFGFEAINNANDRETVMDRIADWLIASYAGPVWYVSPTGDDATGDGSEPTPWRTISYAISQAPAGDTIKVMDDDDEATDDYVENITVNKPLTIERYNDTDANPQVKASDSSNPVFHVTSNNVTIQGLDVYGTMGSNKAGIRLSEVTGCTVQDSRCGWDQHANFYGIDLYSSNNNNLSGNICSYNNAGIRLYSSNDNDLSDNDCSSNNHGIFLYLSSDSNSLSGNTCNLNNNDGILLSSSSSNTLSYNTCSDNHNGIRLQSSSDSNSLSGNTCSDNSNGIYLHSSSNNDLSDNNCPSNTQGIYLSSSSSNSLSGNTCNSNNNNGIVLESSSDSNNLSGNTCNSNNNSNGIVLGSSSGNTITGNMCSSNNSYGLFLSSSNSSIIYLNNFGGNTSGNVYSNSSMNTWRSPTKLGYLYGGSTQTYKRDMGNYYSDYTGSDGDNDGIGDNGYDLPGSEPDDAYPLMQTPDNYDLQVWWLANPMMVQGDLSKPGATVAIDAGSSQIWTAHEAAATAIAFGAGSVSDSTTWTGQMTFRDTLLTGHTFTVEIGYADDSDGTNFWEDGPEATLTGDDATAAFAYATNAVSFTVASGKYLAVRITNNSGSSYAVRVGGSWSYCAAPGSQVLANVRIFLEGSYQAAGDSMTTGLYNAGVIPLSSPYDTLAPRTVDSIPEGVTDWILVGLRNKADSAAVSQQSFFLKSDGNIVDIDGTTTDLAMPGVGDGDYWIVVYHRNHLAVMSVAAQSLNSGSASAYDFTMGSDKFYGATVGAKELESGVWGMITGDASGNGQVQNDDKNDYWQVQVGMAGYQSADFNLNGQVQNDDKNDYWQFNVGRGTQVP